MSSGRLRPRLSMMEKRQRSWSSKLQDMLSDLECAYWAEAPLEEHELDVDGWCMYMDRHEGSIAVHEHRDGRSPVLLCRQSC
jgi:hypothetical protein